MSGIPSHLNNALRATLLDCGPFSSDRQLWSAFADAQLRPFRDHLPEADTRVDRVAATIAYLLTQRRADTQETALVIFVNVLRTQFEPANDCHKRLENLVQQLQEALGSDHNSTSRNIKQKEELVNQEVHRTQLREILDTRFDESELRNLVFDLEIDYETLQGNTKMDKSRELVRYVERRNRISDLTAAIRQLRPDIGL